jgi:thiosulfate/3-mercaptopyruvate sulfurtransferase
MFQDFGRERMVRRKFLTVLCALFLFSLLFFSHQTVIAGTDAQALVETSWLADNLKNPGLAIVYVGGPASKKENFEIKHIPGAVYLDFSALMGAFGDGSTPPDKAKFEALAGSLGIGNDNHVIIHSGDTLFSATAFWLFDYFGHKKLSIMNGPITKWMNEGRATAGGPAKITPAMYKATPNASLFATADDVLKNLKNPKAVILDVRGADEYKGVMSPPGIQNKQMGRIPGSVNVDFFSANLNNDGTFKSANDLKAAYEAKGVTKDKEIIVYCQAGVRASVSVLALNHILGYPKVRNYVGSWGEWGNRLDTAKYPIEK